VIPEGLRVRWARAELTASRGLEELGRVSFVNIQDLFQVDGQLKPVTEWSEERR
jgi:hypothetical protein